MVCFALRPGVSVVVAFAGLQDAVSMLAERPVHTGWSYEDTDDYGEVCHTGELSPRCGTASWSKVSPGCSITPYDAIYSNFSTVGWQSPIDAPFSKANVHPTAVPLDFSMGRPPLTPGKPNVACSQAVMISRAGGTEVSFSHEAFAKFHMEKCPKPGKVLKTSHLFNPGHPIEAPGPCLQKCAVGSAGFSRIPFDPLNPLPPEVLAGEGGALTSYHWHSPSEHMIDGGYFPMEAQLVHGRPEEGATIIAVFMTGRPDLESKCVPANIASMSIAEQMECTRAIFFDSIQKVVTPAADFEAGTAGVKKIMVGADEDGNCHFGQGCTQVVESYQKVINSAELLSRKLDPYAASFIPGMKYFYYYAGSLTTPPCSTTVSWILNPNIVTVFSSSIDLYRKNIQQFPKNKLRHSALPKILWSPVASPAQQIGDFAKSSVAWDKYDNNRPIQQLVGAPTLSERSPDKCGVPGTLNSHSGKPYKRACSPPTVRKFWLIGNPKDAGKSLTYLDSMPMWASGVDPSLKSGMSSSGSSESDVFYSTNTLNSMGSGSSGFYMAIWKWVFLGALLCCCGVMCCYPVLQEYGQRTRKGNGKPSKKDMTGVSRDITIAPEEDGESRLLCGC